jgi:helicase
MNKQEHLAETYRMLEILIDEPTFRNNLSQVRARAIQEELLPELPQVGFTFDAKQMWRYCDYIFSESGMLLRDGYGNENSLANWVRHSAQAFEFLSKFAEQDEREILLLNSAMCYHIAGYQANAQCLARLIEKKYLLGEPGEVEDSAPDALLTSLFRYSLVSFLRRDISRLHQITTEAVFSIRNLQETVTAGIANGTLSVVEMFNLTAHAYYQQSLSDFVQYCLNGDPEHFSTARRNIQKSHAYFQKVGDATLGTIASELRTVLDLFDTRSTWSSVSAYARGLLEDRIWQIYLRNLALEKSIVEFWLSQLKAIHSGILTAEDSFVVQMPTSAGKTLIAELSILAALTSEEQARCLYIAPYRALVNEIESSLAETLGAVGYRVSNLVGGFEFDAFQDFLLRESDVLVATPEKVELFLRTHPDYFQSLSVIVIDEGHIVDEGVPSLEELDDDEETLRSKLDREGTLGRGSLLELLITRLKRKLPEARFLFLSAVMPEVNASDFVEWLSKNRQEPLRIERSDRPSRQLIAKFEWISEQNGELEYISLPKLPNGRFPFVPFFIKRSRYFTGELTPKGRPRKRSWPDPGNKAQSTAMLAARFAKTGPVLVFCAQPQHVRWIVNNIITSLKYLEESELLPNDKLKYVEEPALESFHLALEWLGEEHLLTRALHRNVALHYGPLPDPLRQAIEDEFRNEEIQIVVSTNTLGQGVNMPVRTAIIYSLERTWSTDDEDDNILRRSKVKKRDFWNICGRAGRAGKETEGQVVFMVTSQRDEDLLAEYKEYANLEEINSALYRLLQALVERRIDQDELIGYLDSHVLAILAEEIVDTQDEAAIRDFLGTSLVGVQALRNNVDLAPLISAIKNASAWVVSKVPDEDLQQVFSSTGLRVESCLSLEVAADQFLENVTKDVLEAEKDKTRCNVDLLRAAFTACQNVPEMKRKATISYHGPEDEFSLIQAWIEGRSISEIRASIWDHGKSEDLSEYIADRIMYKLPWGFNGFLRILAFKLQMDYEALPIAWQHLPSMIKFGVDDAVACWACSLGVSSRELALQLAVRYQPEKEASFLDFIKWMVNLPTEFIVYELEGYDFEKQRLLDRISRILPDREHLEFLRNAAQELRSPVQGIRYEDRWSSASGVREGDQLVLEIEPDNPYDRFAVRVIFEGSHIGYVQRAKARIVSREIQLGRDVQSYARVVKPATDDHPFPQIEMGITFA